MTGQTRRTPSVPAPAPQRTAATHASGAHEFSYRSYRLKSSTTLNSRCATGVTQRLGDPVHGLDGEAIGESISRDARV